MTEHTPGPWKVVHDDEGIYIDTGPETARWDCPASDYSEADYANARLIATVPDLLAVCEKVYEVLRDLDAKNMADMCYCEETDLLKAVIDAAKGSEE